MFLTYLKLILLNTLPKEPQWQDYFADWHEPMKNKSENMLVKDPNGMMCGYCRIGSLEKSDLERSK